MPIKGYKQTEEHKRRIGFSNKGKLNGRHNSPLTQIKKGEHLSSFTEFKKDQIPFNKNKKGIQEAWNKNKPNPYWLGKNNPNWKGGISQYTRSERENAMSKIEYKQWRWNIFVRDNFICQICGKSKDLIANHIKRWIDFPELRLDINNGITICKNCDHKLVMGRERDWESYFNFNLMARKVLILTAGGK